MQRASNHVVKPTEDAPFINVYDDLTRAEAYSALEFPGTYHLAYRDLPAIFEKHVTGHSALDFGCGAGRSTRFLKQVGFDARGVDISHSMIQMAKKIDPLGSYQLINDGDFSSFSHASLDLIFSGFAFDNIPDVLNRNRLLNNLRRLLKNDGRVVLLDSTPEMYTHEWASFTTKDFPENRLAKSGDKVRIVMKDVVDSRPIEDLLWFQEDYLELFIRSGLELLASYRPLGTSDDPYVWVTEASISPWVIYVLGQRKNEV